ncbi:MAG TPA: MFS transporter [Caulobacteraceae bacterium]|jgi:MFS family permease
MTTTAPPRRTASLWRHADFLKLWGAQAVSAFGARIAREGLPMTAVLVLKAPPASMGALMAVGLASYGAQGVVAGWLADRLPRRALMIGADLGRMALMLAVPAAALAHALDLVELALALGLMSALTALFDVADHAFLPSVIERELLVDGNAKLATTDSLAEIGGPAAAGVLFQLFAAPVAVALSAVTYLASALALAALPVRPAAADTDDDAPPAPFAPLAGFRAALTHPVVRPIWLMATAGDFFGWFFGALYLIYALTVLRLTTAELGLTIAAGGVGALIGATLAPLATRALGAGRAIVLASLAMGAAAFLIPLAGGAPATAMAVLIAAQLVGDALRAVTEIAEASLRQSILPAAQLGRIAGAFAAGRGGAGVLGALIGGALGSWIGPRETLLLGAAGVTAVPLIGLASPLWRARVRAGGD